MVTVFSSGYFSSLEALATILDFTSGFSLRFAFFTVIIICFPLVISMFVPPFEAFVSVVPSTGVFAEAGVLAAISASGFALGAREEVVGAASRLGRGSEDAPGFGKGALSAF